MNVNVEVFVHGVPNGESFWGKHDEERNFFGLFYRQDCNDEVKFLIQTRSSNATRYCYYSYLVYKNVLANEGRNGSYFGLTIRFGAYCKDFLLLYKILDTVFTTQVLNKILKFQNGKYKYTITDFGSSSEMMDKIYQATLQLVQSSLTNESFEELSGFAMGGSNLPTGNIYEKTVNDVETYVKQFGKMALSPYYPTVRESEVVRLYDSKLQTAKQQYDERYRAELEAKDGTIRSLNASLASIQGEYGRLRNEITQKDSLINSLKSEIERIGNTKKTIKNLELIKDPIIELAKLLGGQELSDKPNTGKNGILFFVKKLIPLANFVLLLLIAVFLLANYSPKRTESNEDVACVQDTTRQSRDEVEGLQTPNAQSAIQEGQTPNSFSQSEAASVNLDVENYDENNGEYLKKNKRCKVSVIGSNDPSNGEWQIEGGHIDGDPKGSQITFVPDAPSVTITYWNPNGESKSCSLKVQN